MNTVTRVLAPVRGTLAAAVALQALGSVAGVAPFVAVAEIGRALLAPEPVASDRIWLLVGLGAGAAVLALIATTLATTLTHLADNRLQLLLRRRIAGHLARVSPGWFSARSSGHVSKALQDDVHSLHYLVGHTLLDVTAVLVTPLAALVYLAAVDWRLALLALVPLVAGALLFRKAMSGAGPLMAEYGRAQTEINAGIVEFVDGIAVVKTFGRGRSAHRRFVAACDAFHDFFASWQRRTTSVTTASQLVVTPSLVLLLLLGAGTVLVVAGWTPATALIPFALLGPAIVAPMGAVGPRIQALRGGTAAAASIEALLAEPVQPQPAVGGEPEGTTVTLHDVAFRYPGTESDALAGVDLELRPGTVTALVGPSGAGKTTLATLVPRFHDVTGGAIRIGGVDVRELDARTLYRSVGFVFQDTTLLRTSVADNIALGRPGAAREEIVDAARAARIHERILALGRGYDAVVGEDAEFSGGERQRLSIARALLADTPVLVLDEATAFADPESEAAICDALSELAVGRTLLVVAHRLHTVAGADEIVVLESGRVTEQGRHDELLALGGRYARMWAAQDGTVLAGQGVPR
ncbi:ABC transporter ATP-binding protein [Pseudonocardia kunmingensis]|uniref:ATP-binding cassette subfamily B protein n=1 Tax=Pseudonocardia kunmingensis TaxID=630975 RepID=A0A543DJ39_9PSEU|nr:ATP-binding cassette subfamily B protein [Pseudonocardia kunmingensis]